MFGGLKLLFDSLVTTDQPARRLKVSDAVPNVAVTNQFGEIARFRDAFIRTDRAVVVNTVYTTCRGSCPGTSSTVERLRKELTPVFGKSLVFLSFTVEPHVDTPAVLKAYAKIYGAGEQRDDLCDWFFLNATQKDTDALRRSLGLFDLDPRVDRDVSEHASLLVVGNIRTDRWCSLPATLRASTLVESIRRTAGFSFQQRYGIPQ